MSIKSILSVAEAYAKMATEDSQNNLAATDAAMAQKKQEPMGEIPSWVPGSIPDEKKKEFAEAAKKAYESDNTQFDFDGRTYKITEKLVGNQDKLDVNGNGKIDADDLAKLRGEKPMKEHHLENEVETPGQTQYPGSDMKDVNKNGIIDGEDKAEIEEGTAQTTHARVQSRYADEASKRASSYGGQNYHLHMIAHHHHANAAAQHERAADTSFDDDVKADHAGGASYHHDAADHHLKAANALKGVKEGTEVNEGKELDSKITNKQKHQVEFDHHDLERIRNFLEKPHHESSKASLHRVLTKHFGDKSVDEAVENPTDKLTLDVPAMIRSLEKAREDFKTDEDIHNFVQDLLKKKDSTIDTNALPTNEALDPKADAGTWIDDFVNSKDPKFAGKSKEERKQQALAAYYQARRDAGLKEEAGNPLSYVARLAKNKAQRIGNMAHDLGAEAKHKDDHNLHMAAHYLHKHAAEKHFTAGEYHPASSNDRDTHYAAANDHNLRAADHLKAAKSQKESVNEGAPADAKAGPEAMDVATKKAKDDNDKNVKTEEAPYTNKADGSENIVPADKPEAKPSPMPKLTKEDTLRSVADAYSEMLKSGQK